MQKYASDNCSGEGMDSPFRDGISWCWHRNGRQSSAARCHCE